MKYMQHSHMQQMEEWEWVPRTDAVLPFWTAIDSLWSRYLNGFSSPVISLRRLPRSLKNRRVSGPQAPDDSMAMGANE